MEKPVKKQRSGGRRGKSARAKARIPQLPVRQVINPNPPMELLNPSQMDQLHATSMRILSEAGIRVVGDNVLKIFADAGAIVDFDEKIVRIDESIVNAALASVPKCFTLSSRNPEKAVIIGENHINFGLVSGPPNVHDMINGRRVGNFEDYQKFVKLAHHFNVIHMIGNQIVPPVELPANSRHLDTYHANLTLSDLTFNCVAIGRGRVLDGINMMAISRGITVEEMARSPGVISVISVNSPRLFDDSMGDGLIAMAEHGQPVTITPFTLMGAMTPVSLPAAMAQQNAEALFGIVLTQLVKIGAPVVYGAFTSNVDMRSGAPAFGTPENTKANIISGQLCRRYGVPYRTSNANASNFVDLQAAYETMMSTWGAVLGGANIVHHAAGWLEGGLTASFEKFVLDIEIIQNMIEFLKPVKFDTDELGFDSIAEVPAGGHFFGTSHTMERFETAFYQPILSDWQNYENWEQAGSKTALTRATEVWQQALEEYEEPKLDQAIREELDEYVIKRREEIGTGEP